MREIGSPAGEHWDITDDTHGAQRAVVVEVGGGLRDYAVDGISIIDGYGPQELCPGSSGQVLAPWPNRIRDGHYTFEGEAYQLPLTEATAHNAIHGLTRWLRWHATEVTTSSVTLECEPAPQPGYPWPLLVRTTWSIGADGLRADHEVTNLAATGCPFGIGAHPYLRITGVAVDDLWLTLPAQSRLLVDARLLPMGAAKVAGSPFDFTEARRIGDATLDTAFGELTRDEHGISTARLATADGSEVREVWADGAYGWWQVFTGDTLHGDRFRRSVAIEPMTCPPDAFRSGRDVVTIQPGDTWRGSWGIRRKSGV